ncbi:DUF3137 domain-containing protein [Salinarimonas sp.]|uniref:DUF3137 domain-containing protein n=1 Tax=Salinarimonas sp. TaxID=2766526 RepID=UPI0032D8D6E2
MIPRFTETAPWEAGFSAIYDAEIAPELGEVEAERQALRRTRNRRIAASVAIGLAAFVFAVAAIPPGDGRVIAFGFVPALTAFAIVASHFLGQAAYSDRLRNLVMPRAARLYGLAYDREAKGAPDVEPFERLGLLPKGELTLSDSVAGRHRDLDVALVEARVRRRGGKGKRVLFRGLLLRVSTETPAPTPIVIAPEHGGPLNALAAAFGRYGGGGLRRVETGLPTFERLFELRAGDPDAARAWLPASLLHGLVALAAEEARWKGEPAVTAAFQGEAFYLAIRRNAPFLEPGALGESVSGLEPHLHALLADLSLPQRLVDRLVGASADVDAA